MSRLTALRRHRWRVPVVSGALIIASWVTAATVADLLMVAAAAVAGIPVLLNAWRAALARVVGIDLLVSVAAVGAIAIGNYWEAAAVTFLFAVGHALESATLAKTRSALADLVAIAPDTAILLRGDEQVEVPATQVLVDDLVLVKNGARVPVDGVVVAGHASLDESSITGESIPVEKADDDPVYAGTMSTGGLLTVRATEVGADTTLARVIHRVEEAQDAKARTQQFMDRFSAWYTPAIIALAVGVGLLTRDLTLALTLLVIGCPGALVISIPVALVAGIGRAARDGILIKGGEFLETAAKIDAVALDKTGTLTLGRPRLTDVVVLDADLTSDEVLWWAARAEAGSEHPLAAPVLQAARERALELGSLPERAEPVTGRGILAVVDGHEVVVGNRAMMAERGIPDADPSLEERLVDEVESLAGAGRTPLVVALDGRLAGNLAVADEIRPEAADMVADLHRAGVREVAMLTGDNALVAAAVANEVGVDTVHAGLLPEDKLDLVTEMQRRGRVVAMVGDGVNDAPALAIADVGVAMGAAGSGVAIETADIALMADRIERLPEAVSIARRTARVMRQNIAIALVMVGALLLGVLFGGVTMAIGMLVHEGSVLLVIANAMRLLRRSQGGARRSRAGGERRRGRPVAETATV